MRAVIYARYSSDLQSAASAQDQIAICKERIAREGWTLAGVFLDEGISGASVLRPGYQNLLQLARSGGCDVVVAEALDRISRDQEHVASLFKQMIFAGVRIVTLAEGEIGELHVGLKGTMNALFLKDLADKTRRGLKGRIEKGRAGGGLCFGYSIQREMAADGTPIRDGRIIDEPEAAIVRQIFSDFATGKSPRKIAFDLNDRGVPGPRGAAWGASTINGNRARGTGILNNELYLGRLVWNRLRYMKDPDSGKRRSRPNSDDAVVVHPVPELRIIDDALWQAVKDRQASAALDTRPDSRSPKPFHQQTRPKFLLSGLIQCGCCGAGYVKVGQHRFGCAAARNKGAAICTNMLTIRRDTFEEIVIAGLRDGLMDPDLFKAFAEAFQAEFNRSRIALRASRAASEQELLRTEKRIRRILDLLLDGDDAPRSLMDDLRTLETRKSQLELELTAAIDHEPLFHPNLAEIYRQKVADLGALLERPDTQQEAFELIRSLIEVIRLIPEDGQLRIELRGELAGILALCGANAKKPGHEGPAFSARQLKMVAGTGFEPVTFRL